MMGKQSCQPVYEFYKGPEEGWHTCDKEDYERHKEMGVEVASNVYVQSDELVEAAEEAAYYLECLNATNSERVVASSIALRLRAALDKVKP